MPNVTIYYFSAYLTYEQFLPFYQGKIKKMQVVDNKGRKIQFPAEHFRSFLTPDGISGSFALKVSSQGKFISLVRNN